jgi:hypothetical protein
MRLDRFKAEILKVSRPPLELPEFNKPIDKVFEFSKHRIFFTQKQKEEHLILEPGSDRYATSDFKHGMKYTFDKVYDENDKLRFQITVGNHDYSSFIRLSYYDKIICNFIHNRYWLLNEKQWFVTFLLSLAAIIISIFALAIKCK